MTKPPECSKCPFAKRSTGFVQDLCPSKPLFAILLKMPGKDEIVQQEPMVGKAGQYFEKEFLRPLGIARRQVMICNTIRCFPNDTDFPIGQMKKDAIATCRQWDTGIREFKPNVVGITFNPAALLRNPQQTRMVRRAVERALEYAKKGKRPLLLMGEEARDTYAPWLDGPQKRWQGHFVEIEVK